MIVNYWPFWFRDLYGRQWPASYCCLDVETTGLDFNRDVILEWGHCLVEDGVVRDRLSLVWDWRKHPEVGPRLAALLDRRQQSLRGPAKARGMIADQIVDRMAKQGVSAREALAFLRDFLGRLQRRGLIVVAHYSSFDEGMIGAHLCRFAQQGGFSFGDNGFLDTEAIERASQRPEEPRFHPQPADTLRRYFHRVQTTSIPGLKSNLSEHCFWKYGFDRHGVRAEEMHQADVDAFCCHLLMEAFRGQIRQDEVLPPPVPLAEAPKVPPPPPVPEPPPRRIRGQRNS